jgi:hypothetical protein
MDAMEERKQQWKAGLVALVVLLGLCLVIPASAAFGDWYNEINADHSTASAIFSELASDVYDMDGTSGDTAGIRLSTGSWEAPNSYYYWHNTTTILSSLNKNNITAFSAGIPTVSENSTAHNQLYNATLNNATPNNNGWPYWIIYFNYRAWDAYYDNAVRIRLNLTKLHTGTSGVTYGDWAQAISLSWGDDEFYSTTLVAADNSLKVNIDLDTHNLRERIVEYGRTSGFLKLKIDKEDYDISLASSAVYSYSSTNLLDRDEPLSVGALAVAVIAGVGAVLVQPNVSMRTLMGRGSRKGKGRKR